jgi:hypothetical protein
MSAEEWLRFFSPFSQTIFFWLTDEHQEKSRICRGFVVNVINILSALFFEALFFVYNSKLVSS